MRDRVEKRIIAVLAIMLVHSVIWFFCRTLDWGRNYGSNSSTYIVLIFVVFAAMSVLPVFTGMALSVIFLRKIYLVIVSQLLFIAVMHINDLSMKLIISNILSVVIVACMMFADRLHKKILFVVIAIVVLFVYYLYEEMRPAVVFHHTGAESDKCGLWKELWLDGKLVNLSPSQWKGVLNNDSREYRLPYTWDWSEGNEIFFYTNKYSIEFKKGEINFRRMDIFLDNDCKYIRHTTTEYFWRRSYRKKE